MSKEHPVYEKIYELAQRLTPVPPDSVEEHERYQQGFEPRVIWQQSEEQPEDEFYEELTEEDLVSEDDTLPTGVQFVDFYGSVFVLRTD